MEGQVQAVGNNDYESKSVRGQVQRVRVTNQKS